MKKVMISQPMHFLTEEEILQAKEKAVHFLEKADFEVVNTFFQDEWYSDEKMEERGVLNKPLCFLAKSLEKMSECDAVYFLKNWELARGCRLEHEAAKAYGMEVLYEE